MGTEPPLKTNAPIDSKTSGQIFMRLGMKIPSVWADVMEYFSFDLRSPKWSKTPLTMYKPN